MNPKCGNCGEPLAHIDMACPVCLPNFYRPSAPRPLVCKFRGKWAVVLNGKYIADGLESKEAALKKAKDAQG